MKYGSSEEMLADYSTITDFFENDKCSGCGNCCSRYLPLSNKEINQIKAYIKRNNIIKQEHAINVLSSIYFDMTCPFLDDNSSNKKCTIYGVRPMICREFTCRKYKSGYIPSMEMYKTPRKLCDVTETFFGEQ